MSRLNFPGALKYFTYRDAGHEIVVGDEDLKVITHALASATGMPRLRLAKSVLPGRAGETTLRLAAKAERALLLELLAQAAHLSADDVAKLPPPVDMAPAATNN